ncbi:MAG: anthranilate synthase component I [Halorhodospira halophila]|uniref:anthranilate synthase component I n=1 Tax=Halorhodospira TaxID=85108 RepID=UPI001911D5E8|nr:MULTISPECIES: anthranilate synthase component I [Halorhodospira]MBK5944395.1 anthranilate synthase component I [Halorhodospira halophila]MCC3751325.1 anthranilate synthase component I [Halorhodospira halophila]MCG5527484.1 anthranilate synthase component I [Halorhodospira halophila]MCG5541514.1 anthranilate synthase component I [Halorhodospira sp. M39old]MCG5544310.1 anthranilate synthase component I [Halorhodospira sp. 9628]
MKEHEFHSLAEAGYTRIPLIREVLADLDTPLSTYLKLARGPRSFLFESVEGGEKWGRYSIIGLPARTEIAVYGHRVEVRRDGALVDEEQVRDPLAWIEAYQHRHRAATPSGFPQMPRFLGGLVGYFGYDTVRYVEPRLAEGAPEDALGLPDICLVEAEEVVVFDNLAGRLYLVVHCDPREPGAYEAGLARLDELAARLAEPVQRPPSRGRGVAAGEPRYNFTQAGFEDAVERIREYIAAGDVMQVVPSQRMSMPFSAEPLDLYRALRCTNPSPYMYFLDLGACQVVGSSPEILVRLEDGEVAVRPIAGTRKRGATEARDRELEQELVSDPKEIAEHVMLIDLGRNDVGRVAETGTVRLTERMVVERYSQVMHIVSNVVGRLRPGLGPMDVLRATFPAGTVSGAPKIRAMEIIDEVEPVKRGVYAGAVGYLSWSGNMDTAIAIRTAVVHDGQVHVQAGAGVVADSVPELEWKETLNKGRALLRAVEMAEAGL